MKFWALSLLVGTAAFGAATAASAADLVISQPLVQDGYVDVGGNWDGVYMGGFVGYGWGTADDVYDWLILESGTAAFDLSGLLAGVALGANFTVTDGIVAGVVGDLAWSGITGEDFSTDAVREAAFDVNWLGSVRGRLGLDGGAFLPYLTAGLAVANATQSLNGSEYIDTQTHIGWTVGAGVEFAVSPDMSVDLLYRYSDYGSTDYTTFYTGTAFDLTAHTVQAGVNFKF